jgi:hypothetical protein
MGSARVTVVPDPEPGLVAATLPPWAIVGCLSFW